MAEKESVLILGSGAREHALGWKIKQSPKVGKIFFAPGNAGTEKIGKNVNFSPMDLDRALEFASDKKVDLTVVGPEAPLAAGIVDSFEGEGRRIFGPTEDAARIESSKIWSHDFNTRHGIPQPWGISYREGQMEYALNLLGALDWISQSVGRGYVDYAQHIVIKADGLAAGKGVELPDNDRQARMAVEGMMSGRNYDGAGKSILIQGRMSGPELSMMAISDGERIAVLPPARDYKRLLDGDKGPNTGGMGAYAPVEDVSLAMLADIKENILQKAVDGMREEGYPFRGALYAGLMLTSEGPKVLEFNCRFGDPETLVQLMLMSSDLYPLLKGSVNGNLDPDQVQWRRGSAASFVLAAEDYPENPKKGDPIHGLDIKRPPTIQIFHAGTKKVGDEIVSSGGRVLGVTAYGDDIWQARARALHQFIEDDLGFRGRQYRSDVAAEAASKAEAKYGTD